MTFKLRVEFSGLCLYVRDPKNNQVIVLMPDCRLGTGATVHPDHSPTTPHVGYLCVDQADLHGSAAMSGGDRKTQLVHRFNRQTVDFGLPSAALPITGSLGMPDFGMFAPRLQFKAGMFGPRPPAELLMRTVLRGGHFKPTSNDKTVWNVPQWLNPPPPPPPKYEANFANYVTWVRTVQSSRVAVTIKSIRGSTSSRLVLRPANGSTVTVKVANLCADNPLEWPELEQRKLMRATDDDFKWFYQLLAPAGGWLPSEKPDLPVPTHGPTHMGLENCFGGQLTL